MKDAELKDTLRNVKTIAVIGISPKEDRPSYIVASYLKSKGYRVIPVRPDGKKFWERRFTIVFPKSQRDHVDVVDIFRKSEEVPPIVAEAIQRGIKVVWMQEGVIHKEAGKKPRRLDQR